MQKARFFKKKKKRERIFTLYLAEVIDRSN